MKDLFVHQKKTIYKEALNLILASKKFYQRKK